MQSEERVIVATKKQDAIYQEQPAGVRQAHEPLANLGNALSPMENEASWDRIVVKERESIGDFEGHGQPGPWVDPCNIAWWPSAFNRIGEGPTVKPFEKEKW